MEITNKSHDLDPGEFGIVNAREFESPEEYADFFGAASQSTTRSYGSSWAGGTLGYGLNVLRSGSLNNLEAAQSIMDKIDLTEFMASITTTLQEAMVGFIPSAPAYIAGHPQAMLMREYHETPNLTSPLKVYVETTISGGCSHEQILSRGVAILAFVLAMEVVRPVDLYTVSLLGTGAFGAICKVASRPMDLGRAVFMLTDPVFARQIAFTGAERLSNDATATMGGRMTRYSGSWPVMSTPMSGEQYETRMRKICGATGEDIFLKGGHVFDSVMMNNPVQWVQDLVKANSKQNLEHFA